MIQEDYCSYEISKLLKEKGFPMGEHLFMYVNKDNVFMTDDYACLKLPWEEYKNFDEVYIPTITHQMAMKWLREVYGLNIFVIQNEENQDCFRAIIQSKLLINGRYGLNRETYEDAVEAALRYSLENLI